MKITMLGAPGVGKSTQAKKVAAEYQIPHISIRNVSHANIKSGTELGMKVKAFMDADGLVPDETTIGMLLGQVHKADCQNGYVLGEFPRTIPQAESLTKALSETGESIDCAVNVDVPDENIVKRMPGCRACLACGAIYHIEFNPPKKGGICDVCDQVPALRDDDKPETVRRRLDVYHDQTQSPIEYYQKAGAPAQVDDTMDMGDVSQTIVKISKA